MTDTTLIAVPFAKLVALDEINARGKTREGLDELAASIAAKGLIQPLAVRPGEKADTYEVIDGRRRYQALAKLVKQKTWKRTDEVPVIVRNEDNAEALETSLMANTVRLPMHAVDQHDVFVRLVEQGASEADIASRFGIAEKSVRQHLALGRLAPVVRDAWRKGKITPEAAKAFTMHPDQDVQASAYEQLKRGSHGAISDYAVRSALRQDRVDVDDYRVAFVGIDAYVAAGGKVTESLFDYDRFVDDAALLDKLVRDKLTAESERMRADGWAWVALASDLPDRWPNSWRGWHHVKGGDTSDCADETEGRYKPDDFTAEERARSGVVIDLDDYYCSEELPFFVYAGVVRPDADDQIDLEDAIDNDDTAGNEWCDEDDDGVDSGSGQSEPVETGPFDISDALKQTISEAQTIAVARSLPDAPYLAMALITAALTCRFNAPSAIRNDGHKTVRQQGTANFADIFAELLLTEKNALCSRFAQAVGTTLDLTHEGWRFKSRDTGIELLVDACPQATYLKEVRAAFIVDDYFSRAKKDVALAAIEEMREAGAADGLAPVDELADVKKIPLATAAAAAATACGWLPPELRTPDYAIGLTAVDGSAPPKRKTKKTKAAA